jgi:NTP pyrophosphatase (non-canonical NTP hydrolase)
MQKPCSVQAVLAPSISNLKVEEALDLLQEECGEVVQARSKLRRFGPEFRGRGGKAEHTAKEEFQREIWDLKIFIRFLENQGFLDGRETSLQHYLNTGKLEKLCQWTTLFEKDVT